MWPSLLGAMAAQTAPLGGSDDGLTFSAILDNLPTDPASIFVLVLLFGSLAGILWVGRSRGPKAPGGGW